MRTMKFDLSKQEKFSAEWDGVIEMQCIDFEERLAISKQINMRIGASGEAEFEGDMQEKMVTVVKALKDKFVSVDVMHKASTTHFTSFEDMSYEMDCFGILLAAAMVLYQGNTLGKK